MYEERITHLRPNNCYQAHLSIYRFARTLCEDAVILDAGCGTGYGSSYLAGPEALPPDGFVPPILDHSVTRRLRPGWGPFIWVYYRTVCIARYEGLKSLFQKAFSKVRTQLAK